MTPTISSSQDHPEHSPHTSESGLILDIFGTLVTFQVRSAETGGAYAILEMVLPVDDAPLRMHLHAAAETFQILDGELEFHTMRHGHPTTFQATAADIVHMPPNVPHGFRNIADSPSTCQIVISPGSMEGYFLELGTPPAPPAKDQLKDQLKGQLANAPAKPPDARRLAEVGRKYGIAFFDGE
jgi:quercetin dioxygenase-like cupin family protein